MGPIVRMHDITMAYRGVPAVKNVDFDLQEGEIHALLGENGAGKSTLTKVMAGVVEPTGGSMSYRGKVVKFASPHEALQAGIAMVFQETSLVPSMSVAQNLYLGAESFLNRLRGTNIAAQQFLQSLNFPVDPTAMVETLGAAKRQMVEIARAVHHEARVIIFDEPTASLTDAEKVVLFEVIADLTSNGVGVIYISHRMEEIFRMTDRISVLRDGEYRGTLVTSETNEDEVTQMMIGRSLDLSRNIQPKELGPIALEVQGLSCGKLFQDVSFDVREGEVVGFYGLVGAGRTEIAETLFGLRNPSDGKIFLKGQEIRINSPIEAIANGISLVPESRKEQGLILGMNCRDNITLPQVDDMTAGPFVSDGAEIAIFEMYRDRLEIKTPSWRTPVGNLSGGNQQKIVIGKWLAMQPSVLIVDEPTRGIDVGSKSEIHNLLRELAAQGYAVIVISSEMPEVLHVSDRVIAMYSGRIMRTFTADEVTEDNLIQAISGLTDDKVA